MNVLNVMLEFVFQFIYNFFCFFFKKSKITFLCNFQEDKYLNLTYTARGLRYVDAESKFLFLYTKNKNIASVLYHLYVLSRSKVVIVDCTHWILSKIILKKETIVIYVGHGGGVYKKMGFEKPVNICRSDEKTIKLYGQYDYIVITTNKFLREVMNNYKVQDRQLLRFGMPRTDDLIRKENKFSSRIKRVLIAPSYVEKSDGTRILKLNLNVIDLILKNIDVCPVLSVHPDMRSVINIPEGWINGNKQNYLTMLNMCDILITDRSSIMFDFCCTNKPIIVMDNRELKNDQWISVDELNGINICHDYDELEKLLKNKYKLIGSEQLYDQQMNLCKGHSSELLARFIEESKK